MDRTRTGPYAPLENFAVQELQDETLVYNLKSHQAHCLNRSAAVIWRHCDGKTSVDGLARKLRETTGGSEDAGVVEVALDDLREAGLVEMPHAVVAGASRREAIKRIAFAGAIAIPLVTTILVPQAASAQSGCTLGQNGDPCMANSDCCSDCCDLGGTCNDPVNCP